MSTPLSAALRRPAWLRPGSFARSVLAWACCLQALGAAAQSATPDDAATRELLRQQERERKALERQAHGPDVRLPVQPDDAAALGRLPMDESSCLLIERIELAGDGAAQFQCALPAAGRTGRGEADPALHRCLGAEDISLVMLYLGLDHGKAGGAGSENLAGTRLTGAVLGLRGGWRAATWDLFVCAPLRKPEGFHTASRTAGFSATWSF